MITPTKNLDLNVCPLRVAAALLGELRQFGMLPVDECESRVQAAVGDDARFTFLPALNILFLVGLIGYVSASDMIALSPTTGSSAG